jgi:hypothetical protein
MVAAYDVQIGQGPDPVQALVRIRAVAYHIPATYMRVRPGGLEERKHGLQGGKIGMNVGKYAV